MEEFEEFKEFQEFKDARGARRRCVKSYPLEGHPLRKMGLGIDDHS
jgi:hypothetical protein